MLLAQAVCDVPASEVLLVASGDLPGVGRSATRLVLDIREKDDAVARPMELTLDGPSLEPRFRRAVVWPRAHLGKDFTLQCLARGGLALAPGGRLCCAVRKHKGADSIADFMGELMGNVRVAARDRGYRLLYSEAGERFDRALAERTLALRYRFCDRALEGVELQSVPGVFSRRGLDEGTRCLIEHAARQGLEPASVVDLCCGIGPLAIWAARTWPAVQVLAVDSNVLAVALAEANVRSAEVDDRVAVMASDGLPQGVAGARVQPGSVDLALVNPPTHAEPDVLARLLGALSWWLRPGGVALVVASRPGRVSEALRVAGASIRPVAYDKYTVVEARFAGAASPSDSA